MPRLAGSLVKYPARVSLAWYLGLIALGALLLLHPLCRMQDKAPIEPLEAIFTATSATCVTGLTVRSTGFDFSPIGQIVILGLIQIGGIGIMTVTTLLTFQIRGRAGLRERQIVAETLGAENERDLRPLVRQVIVWSVSIEAVGFVILAIRNLFDSDLSLGDALWHALFHSVSAFCNAGFGLFDDNLMRYQGDFVVNFTIGTLIILGGIGFPVMADVRRNWHGEWNDRWKRLLVHSKVMLIGTAFLILAGMLTFLVIEWRGVLENRPWWEKGLISFFSSVTCRTAGFNTVEIGSLTNATLFTMIMLMLIGAGPCSTGGGFKVSTFMTLVLNAWSMFRGDARINIFRRTIAPQMVSKAIATMLIFFVVVTVALTLMLAMEHRQLPHNQSQGLFLEVFFEVASALGTVGLSTGLTPTLGTGGRIVIAVLMFLGRLGPISVLLAISHSQREQSIEFPYESPLIG
jgi:trk system potassium uptake protein TrkH